MPVDEGRGTGIPEDQRPPTLGAPPSLWRRIFDFNQADRDLWVAQQAATIPSGARVLDIGAGSCLYRKLFTHCVYETHDFAQLPADALFAGVGYGRIDYVSDITAIPVPDATFDAALCTEVLEHVPDPVAAVKEFSRLLKPGGTLILTAPLGSGIHQAPYHFYGGFTPYWYERYLAEAGFEEIRVEPNGGFFRFYGQESQRLNAMLHPRRFRGAAKLLAAAAYIATYPVLRIAAPIGFHLLDRADHEHSFTIGYHVRARRRQ
jgi:SAM-dependent methyltransferase